MMSSSSLIMVHMAPCFQKLWPFVNEIHHLKQCPLSKLNTFDQNFMKLDHIVKYHDVFFKFNNGPYRTRLSAVNALCYKIFLSENSRPIFMPPY